MNIQEKNQRYYTGLSETIMQAIDLEDYVYAHRIAEKLVKELEMKTNETN